MLTRCLKGTLSLPTVSNDSGWFTRKNPGPTCAAEQPSSRVFFGSRKKKKTSLRCRETVLANLDHPDPVKRQWFWDTGIHLVTAENNNAKKKVQLIDVQGCMIDDCFSIVVLDTKRNGTFFVHLSLIDVQGTKIRINSGVVTLRELSLKNH